MEEGDRLLSAAVWMDSKIVYVSLLDGRTLDGDCTRASFSFTRRVRRKMKVSDADKMAAVNSDQVIAIL